MAKTEAVQLLVHWGGAGKRNREEKTKKDGGRFKEKKSFPLQELPDSLNKEDRTLPY